VALGGIEDDREAVEEYVTAEDLVDFGGGGAPCAFGRLLRLGAKVRALPTSLSEGS